MITLQYLEKMIPKTPKQQVKFNYTRNVFMVVFGMELMAVTAYSGLLYRLNKSQELRLNYMTGHWLKQKLALSYYFWITKSSKVDVLALDIANWKLMGIEVEAESPMLGFKNKNKTTMHFE